MKEKLLTGFGVQFALRGHDMHGLRFGPDGKLYFSIGDRALHVTTKEGKKIAQTESGSIMRCNPDGTKFEIFATGVRNPQELAFNEHGNLFTGDNNSDAGDKARFTYLVEGGDCGWRMAFQYLADRGPWMREKPWDAKESRKRRALHRAVRREYRQRAERADLQSRAPGSRRNISGHFYPQRFPRRRERQRGARNRRRSERRFFQGQSVAIW